MKNGITSHWMSTPVKTVAPKTYIMEARQIMNTEKIRALPVVQEEKVVGIITWRGLLRADIPVIDGVRWTKEIVLKEKRIEDIMTVNPIGVLPNSPLPKSARVMLENKIPVLPVFDEKRGAQGILTTSDVFRFIMNELPDLKTILRVEDYMTSDLVVVDPDTSLLEAQRLMGIKRIRSLPVVEDGKLVGLVTRTDMVKVEPSRFASPHNQEQSLAILLQPIEKIMTRCLVTTTPKANLVLAASSMLENKIHCLPVLDGEGQLSGIITDSDLFRMVVKKFL
jgi:acetoin utilization protein AcuB